MVQVDKTAVLPKLGEVNDAATEVSCFVAYWVTNLALWHHLCSIIDYHTLGRTA